MYKNKKLLVSIAAFSVLFCIMAFAIYFVINSMRKSPYDFIFFPVITAGTILMVLFVVATMLRRRILEKLKERALNSDETKILTDFIDELRFCYSLDDFYEAIGSVLEVRGDCSVLVVNSESNYVLYNSPSRLSCDENIMSTLELNYPSNWEDGLFFMGERYGVVSNVKLSRGFFICKDKIHFYVFCRYTKLFDSEIFKILFDEFSRMLARTSTISTLTEISSVSKEWKQLADTQKSFLPPVMPKIDHLSVAAYFRPLVNVSGDYYTVLPISPTKTLLMLGDVSGKGLAAALVMGLVMNTVKILENKEDLPGVIRAVHKAIKGMKLQDKYTVVFIGIVDTEKMVIRYVNASMSDPLIITNSPSGYKIKPLTSNCSLVGIIDLDEINVDEQRLFRDDVILMASDGVSEVMNEEGVELGDTELYENTIKKSAKKSPQEFINDVVNLIMDYNGGKKLRDDVTMMVAKVTR